MSSSVDKSGVKAELVSCTFDAHAAQILDIFNEAIVHSTALFDYKPRTMENMRAWFDAKLAGKFPVLGLVGADGALMAFASYGSFRAWPAYKYSVEHSVYVHKDFRGLGLGRLMMEELISAARAQDYHLMIGGIEASNVGSIKLHESLGFTHAGTISQAGFKFGKWLDLSFYQLLLPTPQNPIDG